MCRPGGGGGGGTGAPRTATGTKMGSGGQAGRGGIGSMAKKLDDDTESTKHEKVSFAMKIRIQKARTAKGMTQKQLAQAIGQRPSVINEYESGKTIPDNGILGKIERALGVKLRGDLSKKPGGKGGKKKKK